MFVTAHTDTTASTSDRISYSSPALRSPSNLRLDPSLLPHKRSVRVIGCGDATDRAMVSAGVKTHWDFETPTASLPTGRPASGSNRVPAFGIACQISSNRPSPHPQHPTHVYTVGRLFIGVASFARTIWALVMSSAERLPCTGVCVVQMIRSPRGRPGHFEYMLPVPSEELSEGHRLRGSIPLHLQEQTANDRPSVLPTGLGGTVCSPASVIMNDPPT